MKLELLTNATVVDDVIRFVPSMSKGKIKSPFNNSNEDDKEESNESDYDEDEDQLEEEELTTEMTVNRVF